MKKRNLPEEGRSAKKKKQLLAKETKEKKGIDMKVPACVEQEGFNNTDDKIPEYLLCPICKELIVSPEMFPCGHTVCQVCSFGISGYGSAFCPVCKARSDKPATNWMVKSIVEAQYPKEAEKRMKEIESLKQCKEKLRLYPGSKRHNDILVEIKKFLDAKPVVTVPEVIEFVQKKRSLRDATEAEVKYFLSTLSIERNWGVFSAIGSHLCIRRMEEIVKWAQKNPENKKWIPLIAIGPENASLRDVAKLFKVDIGEQLPLQDWRSAPAFWIKDIDVNERAPGVPAYPDPEIMSDSDDFSDEEHFCPDCGEPRFCPDCGRVHHFH